KEEVHTQPRTSQAALPRFSGVLPYQGPPEARWHHPMPKQADVANRVSARFQEWQLRSGAKASHAETSLYVLFLAMPVRGRGPRASIYGATGCMILSIGRPTIFSNG